MFFEKKIIEISSKYAGTYLCGSLVLIKVAGLGGNLM